MLDLKELRKDPTATEAKLKNKVPEVSVPSIIALDEKPVSYTHLTLPTILLV